MDHKIKEKIIEKAIFLEKYGLYDLAWSKKDAQTLINSIIKDKIGILGGDVYELTPHHLKPLYDNWSCEPYEAESLEEYYLRSKTESLSYIEKYPMHSEEKIVFSITFTEKIE